MIFIRSIYKRIFLCAALSLFVSLCFSQPRTETSLNQYWQFTKGSYTPGSADTQTAWETVSLPHTWNKEDVNDDTPGYYRGTGWYKKNITVNSTLKNKSVYLYFNGANQQTAVYVNGHKAGTHIGGYTHFCFEIGQYLNFDQPDKNEITVQVDNSFNENIPPLTADFTFYGGIYRSVNLIAVSKTHFDFADAANGVFVTTPQVSAAKALVKINGKIIIQPAGFSGKLKLVTTISDANYKTVATKTNVINKVTGSEVAFIQDLPEVASPHLWTTDDPYLYHVITQVYDNSTKELLDEVTNPLGFRWVKFDAEKGFFLNDKPLKLIGVSRHQDFPGLGNALPESYHQHDMQLLKEMGGNFLRIAHYPQDPAILESCDKLGILATIEIPIVNTITESDAFTNNSKQMQLEMIHQNFNHPALIVWGYMNEILLRPKFSGDKPRQQQYIANITKLAQELENLTRKEDPSRYTMMADHGSYDGYKNAGLLQIPMLVGWNLYSGWYGGVTADFGKFLDRFHKEFPDKPVMVTEFGADADPRIRAVKPEKFDKSVEYALGFHKVYLDAILDRPFVSGAMVWNLADFNSESREETMPHVNNKGLLTLNREPKDTYRFYQSKLLTTPFIKISNWKTRSGVADSLDNNHCTQIVTVFSNAPSVQLTVNNSKLEVKKTEDGMAVYSVPFTNGINTLEAVTTINGKEYRDQIEVNFSLLPNNFKSAQAFKQINVLLGARHIYIEPVTKTIWLPDQVYKSGQFGHTGGKIYGGTNNRLPYGTDRSIRNTDNDPIYQTQQVGITSYHLDVPQGEYELTLHFAELVSDEKKEALAYNLDSHVYNEKTQDRLFDVLVNGQVALKDFSPAAKYGYLTAGYEKMKISVHDDKGLDIQFKPIKGEPILNALQLSKIY